MEKRIFVGLSSVLAVGLLLWYLLIYQAQVSHAETIETEMQTILTKVNNARHAQLNMEEIERKFKQQQNSLNRERTRFIDKKEISSVTVTMNEFSKKYKLKMMDFTSAFDTYFAETEENKIVPLTLVITVHGRYMDIGSFAENWHTLPFYIIAEEIAISRFEEKKNMLEAQITAKLYTWNN